MQIVVAEDRGRLAGFRQGLHPTQGGERLGSAIDEVADEDEAFRSRQARGELFEAGKAALQVADGIRAHAGILAGAIAALC